VTEWLEAGGGKWSAFVGAAAAAAGHNSVRGGGLAIHVRPHGGSGSAPWSTLASGVRVTWPVGSAPKGYCPGCLAARADSGAGQLFRPGALVQARPRLLWEDRYLTGPAAPGSRHRGNAISRIA